MTLREFIQLFRHREKELADSVCDCCGGPTPETKLAAIGVDKWVCERCRGADDGSP